MNYITTIIQYPKKPPPEQRGRMTRAQHAMAANKRKRAARAAAGLCQQCGGERPCGNHNKAAK